MYMSLISKQNIYFKKYNYIHLTNVKKPFKYLKEKKVTPNSLFPD